MIGQLPLVEGFNQFSQIAGTLPDLIHYGLNGAASALVILYCFNQMHPTADLPNSLGQPDWMALML